MVTVKLKVIHRLFLLSIVNGIGKNSLSVLSNALNVFEKLNFKEEERKELDLRFEAKDDGSGQWKWGDEKDTEKDFELSDEQAEMLKKLISDKDEKKEFTVSECVPMVYVCEQLGIEMK